MRIRKFNESDDLIKISNERVDEIINELSSISSMIDEKSKVVARLFSELENYRSKSKKSNNQIDDASLSIDSVKVKLDESTTLIDNIINLLKNYTENGEKYLY